MLLGGVVALGTPKHCVGPFNANHAKVGLALTVKCIPIMNGAVKKKAVRAGLEKLDAVGAKLASLKNRRDGAAGADRLSGIATGYRCRWIEPWGLRVPLLRRERFEGNSRVCCDAKCWRLTKVFDTHRVRAGMRECVSAAFGDDVLYEYIGAQLLSRDPAGLMEGPPSEQDGYEREAGGNLVRSGLKAVDFGGFGATAIFRGGVFWGLARVEQFHRNWKRIRAALLCCGRRWVLTGDSLRLEVL